MSIQVEKERVATKMTTKWDEIAKISSELRNRITEVQFLLRASNTHVDPRYTASVNPPPAANCYISPTQGREVNWKAYDPRKWQFCQSNISFREIWSEWREGTRIKPSVQWMEQQYGPRDKWLDASQQMAGIVRSKIVQEIDRNLDFGRPFAEICAAGEAVASREGSLIKVAKLIVLNEASNRSTFYS